MSQFQKHIEEIEGSLTEEEEIYKENILDHYKHPHNKGSLKEHTFKHSELNPTCGDEITLYLDIKNNKVTEVSFEGHGCAISQASASLLTDELKGKTVEQLKKLTKDDVYKLLGIPISVTRIKCALLPWMTFEEAMAGHKHVEIS